MLTWQKILESLLLARMGQLMSAAQRSGQELVQQEARRLTQKKTR